MTAITPPPHKKSVDEQIAQKIPPQWKHDGAFLNMARSIHSVAYMKLATFNMKKYMKYREIDTPEALLKEEPRTIEQAIGGFLADGCKDTTNRSKRVTFATLKLFYTQNDVNLNWSKLSKRIGPRERSTNRAYTIEEIKQMLEHTDQRGRVVVLLLASTGMRLGALPSLNIGDLKAVEYGTQKIYAITVYRGEPEEYVTFTTPECAKAIDNYIDFRKRIREVIKQSSPLIRNSIDIVTAENNPDYRIAKRIERGGLRGMMEKIVTGSGVKGKLEKTFEKPQATRYEAHLSRGFRKYYFRALTRAKIEPIHKHALTGHKEGTGNIEASQLAMIYEAPQETELFESYVKAIDYLTIDQSNILARENQDLKGKLETTEVLRKELQDLKVELFQEMEKRLKTTNGGEIPSKHLIGYTEYKWTKMSSDDREEQLRIQDEVQAEWDREAKEQRRLLEEYEEQANGEHQKKVKELN